MTARQALHQRFAQWRRTQLQRQWTGLSAVLDQSHEWWMERPNLYVEYDIGTKNVRYPDGRVRSVRTRKVRDTAGVTFLVFDSATPLS